MTEYERQVSGMKTEDIKREYSNIQKEISKINTSVGTYERGLGSMVKKPRLEQMKGEVHHNNGKYEVLQKRSPNKKYKTLITAFKDDSLVKRIDKLIDKV